MQGCSRFGASATIRCALVFMLAFAVFGWGLHAKLSLYKTSAHSVGSAAKLSTEDRSTALCDAGSLEKITPTGVEVFASRAAVELLQVAALAPERIEAAEPRVRCAFGCASSGPATMLRPPPVRA